MENPSQMEVYSWENHLFLSDMFNSYVKSGLGYTKLSSRIIIEMLPAMYILIIKLPAMYILII